MKYKISKIKDGPLRLRLTELGFLPGKEIELEEGKFMVIFRLSANNKYSLSRRAFNEHIELEEKENDG